MASFRPKAATATTPSTLHGTTATLNTQRFRTPIKIEFNVSSTQTAFNLPKEHCAILKLLVAKDPTMEIVPKDGKPNITNLLEFPANEEACGKLFDYAIQKQPADAKKMLIAHTLITNTKFSDLKFSNPALMDYMYQNKIWLKFNQSESLEISSLGFMQDVHPRISFRDDFRYHLDQAIHTEMTTAETEKIKELLVTSKKRDNTGDELKPEIRLEVMARHIGFGNGDARIKTDAFEIRVPLEIRIEIKEILTRLGNKGTIPEGRFIPYGLAQTVGANVHKQMIRMQNDFLRNFRVIPVFGLLPSALSHEITLTNEDDTETRQTVEQFIVSQPSIHGIEITNRTQDLGKIFFKSDAANILQARDFVDNVIKQLYESNEIPEDKRLAQFNPPRRGDAPRVASTMFSSYATALANLGNPQEEDDSTSHNNAPPPRPNRRNLNVTYDLAGDFPNLPRRNNQNPVVQNTIPQTANPQTENPQNADPQTQPTPSVTQDTLTKFREDLKREFTEMIKSEVKNQIQQEMAAMKETVNRVSEKIDSMQGKIRDDIATTIRETMKAAFQNPQQIQQAPTQEQTQQAPTQPTNNLSTNQTPQPQPIHQHDSSTVEEMQDQDSGPHSQDAMGAQN